MKWLLLVCAFLVQFFAAMPCADERANSGRHTTIAASCEDHHAPGADHCSPFCSCSCCGTCTVQVGEVGQVFQAEVFLRDYPFPHHFALSEIESPVWQPPQLF